MRTLDGYHLFNPYDLLLGPNEEYGMVAKDGGGSLSVEVILSPSGERVRVEQGDPAWRRVGRHTPGRPW